MNAQQGGWNTLYAALQNGDLERVQLVLASAPTTTRAGSIWR
jgi:hypothetical protein